MVTLGKWRNFAKLWSVALGTTLAVLLGQVGQAAFAQGLDLSPQPLVHKVQAANDRLELVVHTSRILTLDAKIPQAQVNNPEVVELVALSPNQIQVYAKKPGVTQVNLWDENKNIHTVDIIVFSDAQELTMILRSTFPKSALKVVPLANSVILSGFVDDPNQIQAIIKIAQDYHPNVINNITVAGAQQVLLQVKVMEVSRTKLRDVGVDFANLGQSGDFVASSISGLIASVSNSASTVTSTGAQTFQFGIMDGGNSFFGVLQLLQQRNIAKILAEPNLVTVSGRPAFFNAGGEFPVIVPQSLGTVSIQYKKFGTQVDFVPIVLGNGMIRLECRPRISEIDDTRSIVINGFNVPAIKVREVDTGVEMRAGQTLAIAGLIQTRVDNQFRGLPWVSDLPWVGAAFRRVKAQNNEIELLILVTPQLVDAMDPHEVPNCGPGMSSTDPNDVDLYFRGHLEVPSCGPCGCGATGPHTHSPTEMLPAGAQEIPEPELTPPEPPSARSSRAPGQAHVSDQPQVRPTRLPPTRPVVRRTAPATNKAGMPSKKVSYGRSNRRSPTPSSERLPPVKRADKKDAPGFIGPVGYDLSK